MLCAVCFIWVYDHTNTVCFETVTPTLCVSRPHRTGPEGTLDKAFEPLILHLAEMIDISKQIKQNARRVRSEHSPSLCRLAQH